MAEDNKVKFEPRVSLGNVLTIVVMVAGGAGVFVRMEVGDARQDERIQAQDGRITALERAQFRQANDVSTKLDQINTRLSTIEGYLRRPAPSPP